MPDGNNGQQDDWAQYKVAAPPPPQAQDEWAQYKTTTTPTSSVGASSPANQSTNVRYAVPNAGVQDVEAGSQAERDLLSKGAKPVTTRTGARVSYNAPTLTGPETPEQFGVRQKVQTQDFRHALGESGAALGAALAPELLPEIATGAGLGMRILGYGSNVATSGLGAGAGTLAGRALGGDISKEGLSQAWRNTANTTTGAAALGAIPFAANEIEGLGASIPERATDVFHRGVRPGSTSAIDEAAMRENFQRAAKYIAPETRAMTIEGGKGGALRSSEVVDQAADRLWQRAVDPAIKTYANAQGDARSVAQDIRSSFTSLDKSTDPAKVAAGEKVAKFFDRPMTVKEMADTVQELNNNRSISRYYNMSDAERTQAELGDPGLRAKVQALNSLRGKLFDTIGQAGGEQLGKSFQEARKDWGALRSVSNQIQETRIPAPEGLATRTANTLRGIYRPEYWATRETLGMLNSPNRLIPKSLNMLGRSDLFPPEVPTLTRGVAEDAEFYDLPTNRPLLGTSPLPSSIPVGPSTMGADEFRTGAPEPSLIPRLGLPEPSQIQLGPSEESQGLLGAQRSLQRDPRTGKMKRVYLGSPQR